MAQVSVGQIENLEDLIKGLESVREALDAAGAWGPLHALLDRLDKLDILPALKDGASIAFAKRLHPQSQNVDRSIEISIHR